MTPLDAFLPNILQYAPGCPIPTAFFGILQAAIEFCERTRLWRYEDEFSVSSDVSEALAVPYGAVPHEIEGVWFDGCELEPKTIDWLDTMLMGWRDGAVSGSPRYVTQTEQTTFRIVPSGTGSVRLAMWLKPAQNAMDLPDFIAADYRETIAHGALSRVLLLPNQGFTNPSMAAGFGQSFQAKIDSIAAKGFTGQQRAPLRSKSFTF